jgi:hypothetical protein
MPLMKGEKPLPPAPTAEEDAKMQARLKQGAMYSPGSQRAKPKPAAKSKSSITGFKSRKRLLDEAMGA